MEFSAKAKYTVFSLSSPDRLVIDLENVDKQSMRKILSGKKMVPGVTGFRIGAPFPDATRLVLDLDKSASGLHASARTASNGNEQILVQWEQAVSQPGSDNAGPAVPTDSQAALSGYLKAAGQGDASAMYRLGAMYANGQGVPQDYRQSVSWYRKAAELGEPMAQFSLGILYDVGQGVAQDYRQAMFWYGKAAEHGNVKAQNNLGFMYSQGKGVAQDYVAAHMWFNISGGRGYEEGRKNRDFVEKLMTPVQIASAQQQAGAWMDAHP